MSNDDFSLEELEAQHAGELPGRQLMTGLALAFRCSAWAASRCTSRPAPSTLFAGVYI